MTIAIRKEATRYMNPSEKFCSPKHLTLVPDSMPSAPRVRARAHWAKMSVSWGGDEDDTHSKDQKCRAGRAARSADATAGTGATDRQSLQVCEWPERTQSHEVLGREPGCMRRGALPRWKGTQYRAAAEGQPRRPDAHMPGVSSPGSSRSRRSKFRPSRRQWI